MFVDRMILITIPSLLMNVLLLLLSIMSKYKLNEGIYFLHCKMCLIVMKQVQK